MGVGARPPEPGAFAIGAPRSGDGGDCAASGCGGRKCTAANEPAQARSLKARDTAKAKQIGVSGALFPGRWRKRLSGPLRASKSFQPPRNADVRCGIIYRRLSNFYNREENFHSTKWYRDAQYAREEAKIRGSPAFVRNGTDRASNAARAAPKKPCPRPASFGCRLNRIEL